MSTYIYIYTHICISTHACIAAQVMSLAEDGDLRGVVKEQPRVSIIISMYT